MYFPFLEMEPLVQNEMCKEGVSDLMKNLLPERYLYKLISHHVNEYTENTISCDLEFKLSNPYYFQPKPYELVSIKTSFPTPPFPSQLSFFIIGL